MSTITNHDRLLTRDDVAQMLGVTRGTLAVWASTRRYNLPVVKVGRAVRYRASDVEAWLERRTLHSNTDEIPSA
jgi:excisionase family DNA binding protein